MDDDRMDDMIRDLARSYREPGATPRDEMWDRIAERRTRQPARTIPAPRRVPWWIGLAAALLLGVAIGRLALTPATTPDAADTSRPVVADAGAPAAEVVTPPVGEAVDTGATALTTAQPQLNDARRAMVAAAPEARRPASPRTPREQPPAAADVSTLYRYVAYETLGQAEALLTIYRAEENAEARARVATWARDVLTSTRLLLDSPAAGDVQLAALLRDLELVLAQIAALDESMEGAADDRELIDEAIRRRDVMPRLRNTIPPGALPAGASS